MDSGAVKELSMKISKSSKPAGTWRQAAGCEMVENKMVDNMKTINWKKRGANKYEEQLSEWSEYSGGARKCEDRELSRILHWW